MKKDQRIAAARAIETDAEGKAPTAVRLWRAGLNRTDKGNVRFTPRSARLVMQRWQSRGNPLVFDYEHESTIELADRRGPDVGIASTISARPEIRPSSDNKGVELWASDIQWTEEAKRQIESGERRQISPLCKFDPDTREIVELVNVALCREGATHFGTILATAGEGNNNVEELIQKIVDALDAGDFEAAENLVQEAEKAGNAGVAKMAKAYAASLKCAADDEGAGAGSGGDGPVVVASDAEPPKDKLAASRKVAPVVLSTEAYSRAVREMQAATKGALRATVEMLIGCSRECFDPADEREHLSAANPDLTRRHIASMKRKLAANTLAASRPAPLEAKPPKGEETDDGSFGLTPIELETCGRENISPKDYAAAKGRQASNVSRRAGKK